MKSIIHDEEQCFMCGTTLNLHSHHIFGGTANRRLSEKYGLKITLCARHHNMSDEGIHFNRDFDLAMKELAQRKFEEKIGSRETFRDIFGKSYL